MITICSQKPYMLHHYLIILKECIEGLPQRGKNICLRGWGNIEYLRMEMIYYVAFEIS